MKLKMIDYSLSRICMYYCIYLDVLQLQWLLGKQFTPFAFEQPVFPRPMLRVLDALHILRSIGMDICRLHLVRSAWRFLWEMTWDEEWLMYFVRHSLIETSSVRNYWYFPYLYEHNFICSFICWKNRGSRRSFYTKLNTWCILVADKLYMENWLGTSGVQTPFSLPYLPT